MTIYSSPQDEGEEEKLRCCAHKRYILAGMLFAGFFIGFSLRANMSIAIIGMTSNRTIIVDGQIVQYEPEFQWSSKTQSMVLGMNSYGFLFSIIIATMTRKCGGITTYGCGLLLAGIITVLNPMIVRFNFYLFLLLRLMEEICAIATLVSVSEIWSRWTARKERSSIISFASTGLYVSNALSFPLCGFLSHIWGWPSTFYFTGAMAIITSLIMILSFSNDPSTDRHVSKKELEYITHKSENSAREEPFVKKVTYRWRQILTSKSVWALFIAKIGNISGYTFITICLPIYIKDITGKEIHDIGILSGIPNLANIITTPIAGYLADYLQNKDILSTTQVHKLYALIGLAFSAVCLFVISSTNNFILIMIFLILFKIFISMNYLVIQLLPLYMAPTHPSLISSITIYGSGIGMIITTFLTGYVVTSHDSYQWSICLTLMGLLMVATCAVFLIFGSSENQNLVLIEKQKDDVQNAHALLPHYDVDKKNDQNFLHVSM